MAISNLATICNDHRSSVNIADSFVDTFYILPPRNLIVSYLISQSTVRTWLDFVLRCSRRKNQEENRTETQILYFFRIANFILSIDF